VRARRRRLGEQAAKGLLDAARCADRLGVRLAVAPAQPDERHVSHSLPVLVEAHVAAGERDP
jgi:hypothetical protein